MKLYSANLSPFAARSRLAVYAKDLSVEILPPPGGTRSAEYLAINPVGKLPCLVLANGDCIPESDTIVEYLADAFPEKALRPAAPEAAARARLLARIGELYVMEPLHDLFAQMNPATRDQTAVDAALAELDQGLAHLDHFLSGEAFAAGPELSLADCQLVPTLFYARAVGPAFGQADPIAKHAKVAAYMASSGEHPAVRKVTAELATALAHYVKTGELT